MLSLPLNYYNRCSNSLRILWTLGLITWTASIYRCLCTHDLYFRAGTRRVVLVLLVWMVNCLLTHIFRRSWISTLLGSGLLLRNMAKITTMMKGSDQEFKGKRFYRWAGECASFKFCAKNKVSRAL